MIKFEAIRVVINDLTVMYRYKLTFITLTFFSRQVRPASDSALSRFWR
jgi:hypothetical protein